MPALLESGSRLGEVVSRRRVHGRTGCSWIKLFILKARPPPLRVHWALSYAPAPVLNPPSASPPPAGDAARGLAFAVGYTTLPFSQGYTVCSLTVSAGPAEGIPSATPSGSRPLRAPLHALLSARAPLRAPLHALP